MKWIEYDSDNPPPAGKYVVKTTTQMNNTNKFECSFSGKNWNCSNQVVTHYLNETHS